jgi:hypothetical protein
MDSGKGNSEILKMIESVNFKLDRLTKAVEALSGGNNKNSEKVIAKEVTKSEVKVAIETPKKEAKTAVVTKKVAKKKMTCGYREVQNTHSAVCIGMKRCQKTSYQYGISVF